MRLHAGGPGIVLLVIACAPANPRAIVWGHEQCAHCHMTLTDHRFAAEVITRTGKVVTFDDVGCLRAWLAADRGPPARVWVADFTVPDEWLPADSAVYLHSDTIRTPMASGLVAVRPGSRADSLDALLGGRLLTWRELGLEPVPSHVPQGN
jgi:copper chaperone NosL